MIAQETKHLYLENVSVPTHLQTLDPQPWE